MDQPTSSPNLSVLTSTVSLVFVLSAQAPSTLPVVCCEELVLLLGLRVGFRVGLGPEADEDDATEAHFPLYPHRSEQHEASNRPSLVQTWPLALQLDKSGSK